MSKGFVVPAQFWLTAIPCHDSSRGVPVSYQFSHLITRHVESENSKATQLLCYFVHNT